MDKQFKIVSRKEARIELNEMGYPLLEDKELESATLNILFSMAKQIKDLQDIVSGPKPSIKHGDGWHNTDTGEFKRYDINIGKWVSQEEFEGNKNA